MNDAKLSRSHKNLSAANTVLHSRRWFIGFMLLFSIILPSSQLLQPSFAQFTEDSLTIEVSKSDQVRVTEEITPRTTVSRISVNAITKNITNILAVDENNIILSSSASEGTIRIDTLGSSHVTLTYSADIVSKTSSNSWQLSYSSDTQSDIILPSGSDIIYVNTIPVDINENIVTMPPGDSITLRYKIKSVATSNFLAFWEDKSYVVQAVTASTIINFTFEQGSKSIVLNVDADTPLLVIIPKSLLGGPYSVKNADDSPAPFKQYYQNSTHSWLRIEPSNTDSIRIIGTTVVPEFILIAFPLAMASAVILLIILKQRSFSTR